MENVQLAITPHLHHYLKTCSTFILFRWNPHRVLLHYLSVYLCRALIHITISQWITRGGRDVWRILETVRVFPQLKPCAKTSQRLPSKSRTDQTVNKTLIKSNIFWFKEGFSDLPCSWQLDLTHNQRFVQQASVPYTITTLNLWTLNTSIKNYRQAITLCRCLSKPHVTLIRALSANLPPSPVCPLHQGRINRTVILALRTNVAWKDNPCLNSQEQCPTLTFISTRSLNID